MVNVWGNLMYVRGEVILDISIPQEYVAVSNDTGVYLGDSEVPIGVSGRDNQSQFAYAISGQSTFIMWSEKVRATSTSPWQTLVSYTSDNGGPWTLLPSLSTTPSSGAQPEMDIATGAISAFSSHGFAVWQNECYRIADRVRSVVVAKSLVSKVQVALDQCSPRLFP